MKIKKNYENLKKNIWKFKKIYYENFKKIIMKTVLQVLVHGEANEMSRLKAALIREYEDDEEANIAVYNPKNTQAVELNFRGEKMAKVL